MISSPAARVATVWPGARALFRRGNSQVSGPSGKMIAMRSGDTPMRRKARGAFFTPPQVARFLVDWAVLDPYAAVLEPSCGEAVFLHQIGSNSGHKGCLVGVELHTDSARESQRILRASGINATIHARDFFLHSEFGVYDAVVGNPPYVRYQDFAGESRSRAKQAALKAGVALSNLASSWAAFTVHSALHLKAGGRLALVLPAELLTVNYASGVRQFLMDRFSSVGLVLFEERVFPGVLEEVVLLLADGYAPDGDSRCNHMTLWQVRDATGLLQLTSARRWTPPSKSAKWSAGLLSATALSAYDTAVNSDDFARLETWGDTTLGMVTGNNRFFTLSPAKVAALELAASDVLPVSPPGSRHLRALTLTRNGLSALGAAGQASCLFRPHDEPSRAAWQYIRSGEALDVHSAYKCRVRAPWWRVPYLRPADLLLTYMNADTPRLSANNARAHHLNSVHGVYLHDGLRDLGRMLPIASLNSLTLLGAEIVGRAYGGGMLKIEPREADNLPVPSPALVGRHLSELQRIRPTLMANLRAGRLLDAVALVDDILLVGAMGIGTKKLQTIRQNHAELTARRITRGRVRVGE
jgi:adenine-specific DNA-methyltransferase